MCAHGREGQTHIDFAPRHSLKNDCMARPRFVFESRLLPFLKKGSAAPASCRPFLFRNPPPQKNKNAERQGERAGRAVLRAWRDSESCHAIGAYERISSHHALGACESVGALAKIGSSVF